MIIPCHAAAAAWGSTKGNSSQYAIVAPDIDRFAVKLIAIGEKSALMRSHFVRAERIAARLVEMGADAAVEREKHAPWVIADKD